MKRRSFFQRVIGGFAAAVGWTPRPSYIPKSINRPYDSADMVVSGAQGYWIVFPAVPGQRIHISAQTKAELDRHFWP